MATPLRPGNVVEVINVLSLSLCSERLFEGLGAVSDLYTISELCDSW